MEISWLLHFGPVVVSVDVVLADLQTKIYCNPI